MEDVVMYSFPCDDVEALAMLYIKNQDLTDVTPEELVKMYDNAYTRIAAVRREQDPDKPEWV